MAYRRVLGRALGLFILAGALFFGMSGMYHEAPWIIPPLIGSAKIELGGMRVSTTAEQLKTPITRREVPLLDYFTRLRKADLRGSDCYREIYDWAYQHPEVEVLYSVPLPGGRGADSSEQELDLRWLTSREVPALAEALLYLPQVRTVYLPDVGGDRLSVNDMDTIHSRLPDAVFHFSVSISNKTFDSEAESVDLRDVRNVSMQDIAVILSCMSRLRSVELGSESRGAISWEEIAMLQQNCPNAKFHYSFTLYGKNADLDTETLDFRGVPVSDNGAELYKALACMNHCTYVDMDNTGVTNESMGQLRELHPETKFVWRIWFGENYSVRTDVERILASKPSVGGMIYDASMLQYCTEMKYLDLGHNDELADFSFVSHMPKLEVLIIAMTAVTDISPLAQCPALEYLELNSTAISDLSPLAACTALHHLNIAGCPNIRDITPLYGLTELERLWIGRNTPVPADQAVHFKALVPGCTVNTTTDDPHGDAWRFTAYDPEIPKYYWVPRYELLREQMGYNYQEYSFYWLDPYCDREAPEQFRGMYGKEVYGL